MIDWTYCHFRRFMRLLVPQALLYTEMQPTGAVLHNPARALYFSAPEQPLALQLGGADKQALVKCAMIAEEKGFVEVNLNLGCPSDRVQAGNFGACLMLKPELVMDCIKALKKVVSIPVTVKMRIGIDNLDSYDFFLEFVQKTVDAGCDKLIVHARKAWLHGLNPKQNRTVPPLHYDYVYRIKKKLLETPIIINGNITLEELDKHIPQVDGIMLGRLACQNPYALTKIYQLFYPQTPIPNLLGVISNYLDYAKDCYAHGVPLSLLLKPILNAAHGLPGARQWKTTLLQAQQQRQWTKLESAVAVLVEAKERAAANFSSVDSKTAY